MASLKIKNITKKFGSVEVLKGISLSIEPGEFLVLVGQIIFGDRVVNNIRPKDRDIAMVFQSYALYPNMNVRQNLSFGLATRKTPKVQIEKTIQNVACC
jgi:multiple sugar transport system ATP-binding protein